MDTRPYFHSILHFAASPFEDEVVQHPQQPRNGEDADTDEGKRQNWCVVGRELELTCEDLTVGTLPDLGLWLHTRHHLLNTFEYSSDEIVTIYSVITWGVWGLGFGVWGLGFG